MNDLLMPSEVKRSDTPGGGASLSPVITTGELPPPPMTGEPPSAKLIVRLFLIPLLIVGAAVGVMFLIGRLAGGTPTTDELIARLKNPGGGRTVDLLIGPGSKQRYLDAKALIDTMRTPGTMTESYRVELANDLIEIIDNHTRPGEGDVRHFLLLALGRTWQRDPSQPPMTSERAIASRRQVVDTLLRYARPAPTTPDGPPKLPAPPAAIADRKAAVLALAYLAGWDEVRAAFPTLIELVRDGTDDLDVRLAAATVLGPLATPQDRDVIDALHAGTRESDPRHAELVWGSALSLAQLNQPEVEGTILMLLRRDELAQLKYYDRETDPQNPTFQPLSDQMQERILINTMEGARKLDSPAVREQIARLAASDPSARVRYAAREILQAEAATSAPQPEAAR